MMALMGTFPVDRRIDEIETAGAVTIQSPVKGALEGVADHRGRDCEA